MAGKLIVDYTVEWYYNEDRGILRFKLENSKRFAKYTVKGNGNYVALLTLLQSEKPVFYDRLKKRFTTF